ncbi:MAG: putative zinc metalloprotease [Acidobacteria bacterium]|nr:putative zinc metalloprotease [Acidobacteriota bacterium]
MIHLGSIGGTSIDIDFSFLFLVAFFVVTRMSPDTPVAYALMWAPIVFLSVLIHEMAHAAAIAALGHGSSRIVLNGWGGVTYNDRKWKPWQNVIISIAGPLASFAIAFGMVWVSSHVAVAQTDLMLRAMVPALLFANIFWGFFNLLPVPPLDGGHAVRAFFRSFLKEKPAFVISIWIAIIGGGVAVIFGLYTRQFFLALFVAFFVWRAIQQWQEFRNRGIIGD